MVEREEPGFQAKCFELWGMLVQGNALTAWSMIVAEHFNTNEEKNAENAFKQAITLYLESLVGLYYIGDQVICQLREQKKPAMIPYCDFEHRREQLLLYVMQNNLLRRMLNIPTAQELVEQLFLAQPKAHQAKYAKISEDVEHDIDMLCTFFKGCHVEDIADGTFQKFKTSIAANCKAKKDKDERTCRSDKAEGGKPHSAGNHCYHCSDRDRDGYHCSDRTDRYNRDHPRHHDDRRDWPS
jgi:hypothetical protein